MSAEENKAVARRCYEAINKAMTAEGLGLLSEVLAPNIVDHNPVPGQGPGLEGVKQTFGQFKAAFSDFSISVEDMVAEGDKVASQVTFHMTHTGEFMGIPATGKRITYPGIDILRIAGGKVVDRWGQFDDIGMMQQMGVLPPPG